MTSTYLTRLAAALDGAGTDPDTLARIAAGVSRWEDISTAPKDGTGFIGFQPVGGGLRIITAMRFMDGNFFAIDFFDPIDDLAAPTHWQPLPEPPTEETKK